MKKNITINLFGALYAIDEDAYGLLHSYLENMRSYYGRRQGEEEIADDVERRVMELFEELKAEGVQAVSIEHVRTIIQRIGNPEEMGPADNSDATTAPAGTPEPPVVPPMASKRRRRWFRDEDNKLLGGVVAGTCHYFGLGDPTIWRLAAVLLCIVSLSTAVLIYLALWLVVPAAKTPVEKLEMRGEDVTPDRLNEELLRTAAPPVPGQAARERSNTVREIVSLLLKLMFGVVVAAILVALLSCVWVLLFAQWPDFFFWDGIPFGTEDRIFLGAMLHSGTAGWIFCGCTLLLALLLAFYLGRWILVPADRRSSRISWAGFVAAIVLFSVFVSSGMVCTINALHKMSPHQMKMYIGTDDDDDIDRYKGWKRHRVHQTQPQPDAEAIADYCGIDTCAVPAPQKPVPAAPQKKQVKRKRKPAVTPAEKKSVVVVIAAQAAPAAAGARDTTRAQE